MPASPGRSLVTLTLVLVSAAPAWSQGLRSRIVAAVDDAVRGPLPGTEQPLAQPESDAGPLAADASLDGVTLVFSRTAEQEAELQALLGAQQDPSSPQYHRWLTPDEFGARFGALAADVALVQDWLRGHGLAVGQLARGRDRLAVSGTVAQVEAAFGAQLHWYDAGGRRRFAPAAGLSLPAALLPVVQTVTNLSTSRLRPHLRTGVRPAFTSAQTGSHFLTPRDVATIYDIAAVHGAGYDGHGQSVAVVGQSAIALADIENFQAAAGLAKKDPTLVLVPGSGTATVVAGDDQESDLDVEYAGAMAPGATIYLVYVGNGPGYGALDAVAYAIDNKTAPVISISYGVCESALAAADYAAFDATLARAAAQGQSVVAAAGDDGSTDCFADTTLTSAQRQALAVDFPGSSQYVTSVGGTELATAAAEPANTTYWQAATGTDVLSSALSYIPEQVWNDDATTTPTRAAGGGGVSALTARPAWQASLPGIPAGSQRLVPDVSLLASPVNAPYLFCSNSTSTGVTGSCAHGFRDANDTYLTTGRGTSFGAPIFAGMLALINQRVGGTGLGVVNPTLYTLAGTSYATVFHDVTVGGNQCNASGLACAVAATSSYAATTGYDAATGLGSVDLAKLVAAWPGTAALVASVTSVSTSTASPRAGESALFTVVVASGSATSTAAPTGTVTLSIDGSTVASLTLAGGSATYTATSLSEGVHTVGATYAGDVTYAASSTTTSLTVLGAPAFSVSATDAVGASGAAIASTVTVSPRNGYVGTVGWRVIASPALANACFTLSEGAVSGEDPVTLVMTIHTSSSTCVGEAAFVAGARVHAGSTQLALGLAALALLVLMGRRRGGRATLAALALVVAVGAVSCHGSTASSAQAAKGRYTLTVAGTDQASASITASTTMTLTVE